ncbi:MAG TPA: DUF2807 domain-containing protein [Flavobacterium sp.]|nr:DUF2807 domain-containing protein [Flavobacterium sp.]
MKKNTVLLIFTLIAFVTFSFGQEKEKIKGTRIVKVTQQDVKDFESIEVEDNIEIFLVKGDKCDIEIEADDNLHDVISIDVKEKTLYISSLKDVSFAKKYSVRVTYTDDLKMVTAKEEASVTALATIKLKDFTFKSFGTAKIYAYAEAETFTLMANDKSKIELNLTSQQTTTIELSKNANFKGLINSNQLTFDMYQKTVAVVEGSATDLVIRTDNDSDFNGKNLIVKNAEINVEGYSDCKIQVSTMATINAVGNSELELYGNPKIEITSFLDKATIYKKTLK